MKVSVTCACGSKFEARWLNARALKTWWLYWQRLHAGCIGINEVDAEDSGKLIISRRNQSINESRGDES